LTNEPLVSLVLCVKNGMPHLPDALLSVAAQTYKNIELVVQDAASGDGTLEAIAALEPDLPPVLLVSEPDGGIGDAYNRAAARCNGEIVGSIDADNVLLPLAVERAVDAIRAQPEVAAVYGGSNMLSPAGEVLYPWMPAPFELVRLLLCELVPPFAVSFFNRTVCGDELRFDPRLRTCADFDLWLRLSPKPIVRVDAILGGTRLGEASMTRREETYDQYIVDKTSAFDSYLGRLEPSPLVGALRARGVAGMHLWAAESVYDIAGARTERFERYLARALELDPGSPWAEQLAELPAVRDTEPEPEPEPEPGFAARLRARAQSVRAPTSSD
jgi:glycosyltransferase involved in cell wall biosynthesis